MSKLKVILVLLLLTFGFAARLYKIENPVADWHSWRQADTAAVTRNFVKYSVSPLLPRYDDFSDVSGKGLFNPNGLRMVEFPLYNLIHYVFIKIFPVVSLEVWGRLTTAIFSLISAILLFLYAKKLSGYRVGIFALFLFLFLPFNIYFSRVILPDPLMVTLYLCANYFFELFFSKTKFHFLIIGILFASLSLLVKPVAIFFLLPILISAFKKYRFLLIKHWGFYLSVAVVILPLLIWRLWISQFPEGIPANMWLLNGNGIRFKGAFFQWIFHQRISSMILGGWGTVLLVIGTLFVSATAGPVVWWIIGALLYLFVFATGNVHHDYYQIPIIPIISLVSAFGLDALLKLPIAKSGIRIRYLMAFIIVAFSLAFSWYQIRGNYQVNHWEIVHAGLRADQILPPDAKVVAPYLGDTAFLYQTNRPGFPFMSLPIKDMIDRFGIGYYISVNYDSETKTIMNKYTVIEAKPEYVIVKLVEPIRP